MCLTHEVVIANQCVYCIFYSSPRPMGLYSVQLYIFTTQHGLQSVRLTCSVGYISSRLLNRIYLRDICLIRSYSSYKFTAAINVVSSIQINITCTCTWGSRASLTEVRNRKGTESGLTWGRLLATAIKPRRFSHRSENIFFLSVLDCI